MSDRFRIVTPEQYEQGYTLMTTDGQYHQYGYRVARFLPDGNYLVYEPEPDDVHGMLPREREARDRRDEARWRAQTQGGEYPPPPPPKRGEEYVVNRQLQMRTEVAESLAAALGTANATIASIALAAGLQEGATGEEIEKRVKAMQVVELPEEAYAVTETFNFENDFVLAISLDEKLAIAYAEEHVKGLPKLERSSDCHWSIKRGMGCGDGITSVTVGKYDLLRAALRPSEQEGTNENG